VIECLAAKLNLDPEDLRLHVLPNSPPPPGVSPAATGSATAGKAAAKPSSNAWTTRSRPSPPAWTSPHARSLPGTRYPAWRPRAGRDGYPEIVPG
jgi:hypothetical protein